MTQPTYPEEVLKEMRQLPPDWWQSAQSASILLKAFKSHIVPLFVVGSVSNKIQYNVYTGILLEHNDIMIWLTAGHVVDELQQLLSSSAFKLSMMAWLDGYQVAMAEGVRLHRTDIPMKSWKMSGLDVGVVV